MKKFFQLLFRVFSWLAKHCNDKIVKIDHLKSKKSAIWFDETEFITWLKLNTPDRKLATSVFKSYREAGFSGMDLGIAIGWMHTKGRSVRQVLETLSDYIEKNTRENTRAFLLQNIIIRPGTIKFA